MKKYSEYEKEEFTFKGQTAIVFFADKKNRTNKWIYKTEYLDAFPDLQSIMLNEGYNLVHIENETRWCRKNDRERQGAFCAFLAEKYNFAEKGAVIGMSCGGMQGIYLASSFPQHVAVMYLDAPVINLLSCPADLGVGHSGLFAEFEEKRHMDIPELLSYRDHPLDRFAELRNSMPPLILVSGDSDQTVPFEENGKLLYDFYKENKGIIELHIKKDGDHHPHGLPDNHVIAEFIKKYY